MIIKAILNIIKILIISSPLGLITLPSLPESFIDSFNDFCDLIFSNAGCVGFFVRPATLNILLPLVISLIGFEKIYYFVLFILKKIPFISVR